MPHRRPPRLPDAVYGGAARVFLTMCTFQRRPYFADGRIADRIRDQLLRTSEQSAIEIVAYCFMPDHLHALVAGTAEDSNAITFARRFRQRAGYDYRRDHSLQLWQEGFFDRVLREEDSTFDVVSYIVANPVGAGLSVSATATHTAGPAGTLWHRSQPSFNGGRIPSHRSLG